jgi:hypothetical protein
MSNLRPKIYTAFELVLASDFILQGLTRALSGCDVSIVEENLQPPLFRRYFVDDEPHVCVGGDKNHIWLEFLGIVRFSAQNGTRLGVSPLIELEASQLSKYILGGGLDLILRQRGYVLLHASAVMVGNSAVAFVGKSTAGKSTMAAAMCARGHRLLADDRVAIAMDGAEPNLLPAFPYMYLCHGTIDAIAGRRSETMPSFASEGKEVVDFCKSFEDRGVPLRIVYILDDSDAIKSELLFGKDAFLPFVRFFPMAYGFLLDSEARGYIAKIAQVTSTVQVRRLSRPRSFSALQPVIDQVVRDVDELQVSAMHDAL